MTKKQTYFRLKINPKLHQQIKLLAVKRRAHGMYLCSISDVIGQAIEDWLKSSDVKLKMKTASKDFIQISFKFKTSEVADMYRQEIIKRLTDNSMRRAGIRLDREESDAILKWWLDLNTKKLEPICITSSPKK